MTGDKEDSWIINTTKIGKSWIIECAFRCYIGGSLFSTKGKKLGIAEIKKELKKQVLKRLEDK